MLFDGCFLHFVAQDLTFAFGLIHVRLDEKMALPRALKLDTLLNTIIHGTTIRKQWCRSLEDVQRLYSFCAKEQKSRYHNAVQCS